MTTHARAGRGLLLAGGLGVVHFTVDASSNFVVVRLLAGASPARIVPVLVAYNFLAFALQPAAGLATDRLRAPRAVMCLGLLLAAAAMLCLGEPIWVPLLLTGLGNALFHVGAGTLASLATAGRASGPGIFIAPGAVGVAVGAAAGMSAPAALWPLFLALLAFAPLGALLPRGIPSRTPASPTTRERPGARSQHTAPRALPRVPRGAAVILALLLLAIALRSLLGVRAGSELARHAGWALPLAVAAALGKALGGVIADRAGWTRTAIASLALSAIFLLGRERSIWAAAAGLACFQAVTSITLAALYRVLPGRIALAFGLACLALFAGGLPALLGLHPSALEGPRVDALLAIVAALAVWRALRATEA